MPSKKLVKHTPKHAEYCRVLVGVVSTESRLSRREKPGRRESKTDKRTTADKAPDIQTADFVIGRILEDERVQKSESQSSSALGMTSGKALDAAPGRRKNIKC